MSTSSDDDKRATWVEDVEQTLPGADLPPKRLRWPRFEDADAAVDAELAREILDRVIDDAKVSPIELHVLARGGRVTLQGRVASPAEREYIEALARDVAPDVPIDNRLVT